MDPYKTTGSATLVYIKCYSYVWSIARLCIETDLHPVVEEGAERRQRERGHEYGDKPELKH